MIYKEKVSYLIDKNNVIVDVFDSWESAAIVGQADYLAKPNNVIGTRLFSYVKGDSTKMYYDLIYQKSRLLNLYQRIPYRCDSPSHMRFMEMEVTPHGNGDLNINNYLIEEKPFRHEVVIHEKHTHTNEYVKRCSICNSLLIDGEWILPEELVEDKPLKFNVFHGVCPSCKKKDWR